MSEIYKLSSYLSDKKPDIGTILDEGEDFIELCVIEDELIGVCDIELSPEGYWLTRWMSTYPRDWFEKIANAIKAERERRNGN